MQPDDTDAAHLLDMVTAGREALRFLAGTSYGEFLANLQLRRAIERDLEIFGEAARRLSDGFRETYPGVPWREVIGLRNILAHDYGNVLPDRVWATASDELEGLVLMLEELLAGLPREYPDRDS